MRVVIEERNGAVVDKVDVMLSIEWSRDDANHFTRAGAVLQKGRHIPEAHKDVTTIPMWGGAQRRLDIVEVEGVLGLG